MATPGADGGSGCICRHRWRAAVGAPQAAKQKEAGAAGEQWCAKRGGRYVWQATAVSTRPQVDRGSDCWPGGLADDALALAGPRTARLHCLRERVKRTRGTAGTERGARRHSAAASGFRPCESVEARTRQHMRSDVVGSHAAPSKPWRTSASCCSDHACPFRGHRRTRCTSAG